MIYDDEWKFLSLRIQGLAKTGELHARYVALQSTPAYSRVDGLLDQSRRILTALEQFRARHETVLSPPAMACIDEFIRRNGSLIHDTSGISELREERLWAVLISLGAFETELSFVLSDNQTLIRSRSERAFAHLQRMIVADEEFRRRWQTAFAAGEVALEKLGATHLLLHGIWAFKVDTAGARTDLVFQEPAGSLVAEQRYAEGLVLTEWKKASDDDDAAAKFVEARTQAARYAQGALAGIELTNYRYAVVVSGEQVPEPDDTRDGTVIYRYINIAVEPLTPSRRS